MKILRRIFGDRTPAPARSEQEGRFDFKGEQDSLIHLFNARDHDGNRTLYMHTNNLDPRLNSQREILEALRIFLAVPGNELKLITDANIYKYDSSFHGFLEVLKKARNVEVYLAPSLADFKFFCRGDDCFLEAEVNGHRLGFLGKDAPVYIARRREDFTAIMERSEKIDLETVKWQAPAARPQPL